MVQAPDPWDNEMSSWRGRVAQGANVTPCLSCNAGREWEPSRVENQNS